MSNRIGRFDNTSGDRGRGYWSGPRLNLLGRTFTRNGGGVGEGNRITQLQVEIL